MLDSILPFLNLIPSAAKAMNWFTRPAKKDKRRGPSSDRRDQGKLAALLSRNEIWNSSGRYQEDIIPKFSTAVFDRLNESGFDFNAVKRGDIPAFDGIKKRTWRLSTQKLIESIYDKIKDIRSLHALSGKTSRRLGPRIINIHKRILLLLRHAKR